MIVWGGGQGLGNWLQALPAIQCLRDQGIQVFCTPSGSWPNIWKVMENNCDGFIEGKDREIEHFLKSTWYYGEICKTAMVHYKAYESINQVELNWQLAEEFYHFTHQKPLPRPEPAKLNIERMNQSKPKFLAIHPAKTLSKHWDYKIFKKWEPLIIELSKNHNVAVVGTSGDTLEITPTDYGAVDARTDRQSPLGHAQFLKDNCYGLITSASGWAFLGPAAGVKTFTLWGPDSLKRNKPLDDLSHILTNGDCQECYNVTNQGTGIPVCHKNNQCMDFDPKGLSDEITNLLSV